MRVTHAILTNHATTYLMRNLEKLQRAQERIATGKNYKFPSENPIAATQIISFTGRIAECEQYRRSIDSGVAWNEMTSSVLTQIEDLLTEIYDISKHVSDSAATSSERAQAASDINSLLEELVMASNRRYRGKYLFGGAETLTAPFTVHYDAASEFITGVTQNPDGIGGAWNYLVSAVDTVVINTPGDEVFQPSGEGTTDDVFQIVVRLCQALQDDDFDAMRAEEENLSAAILHIAGVNAGVGSRINRLESLDGDLDTTVLSYEEERSRLEDAGIAEAIVEYNAAESIYYAALSTTARILSFSLVNFL